MSKFKAPTQTFLKSWLGKLGEEERKNFKIEGHGIFCRPCGKLYDWQKISQLNQHKDGGKHVNNCRRQNLDGQQTMLTESKKSEFNGDLCKALLSADIPMFKLKNPVFRDFLEKYTKKQVPDESTLRKNYIPDIHNKIIGNIRAEIQNQKIFLQVDETTDKTGRFVANIIVGGLTKHSATTPHLLMSKQLSTTDNTTITQLVVDALQLLWPKMKQAEISDRFLVLLTDGARYMVKAGRILKALYPGLIHVTCLAHGLHRVAEFIRSNYNNVDQLIANIKAIFKKAPSRVRKYKQMFPDLALPPEPVLTRWGTWLETVDFLAENYTSVRQVVLALDKNDAECIRRAQDMFETNEVAAQLAELSANYTFIAENIKKLEGRSLSLVDSINIFEGTKAKLQSCSSVHKEKILKKFDYVVSNNPGLEKMLVMSRILSGLESQSDNGMSPDAIASLSFCPLTYVEVERSFSVAKSLLNSNRLRFTMKNYEMCLVCHYELTDKKI